MAELIDREATYEVLTSFYHHKTDIQHNALREALNKVPSADTNISDFSDKLWAAAYERGKADAVRHGHWLRTGRTNVYGGFEVECSVCNDNVMITNIEYEHYCRNCGARMDEGSE